MKDKMETIKKKRKDKRKDMATLNERQKEIVQLIHEGKKMSVNTLSEKTGVSTVTIRKDLKFLENIGLIERIHGYACILNSDDINNRMDYAYELKEKIAKRAADLVEDGETIMVESGSSCALFVMELAKRKKNVTILTNSVFISDFVRNEESIRIVLLGGEIQRDSRALIGPLLEQTVKNFLVDKFFLGTDGYTEENGFRIADYMRAQAVRAMVDQASHVYVLTDSSKFTKKSLVNQLPAEKIHMVITDQGISQEMIHSLNKHGVRVMLSENGQEFSDFKEKGEDLASH